MAETIYITGVESGQPIVINGVGEVQQVLVTGTVAAKGEKGDAGRDGTNGTPGINSWGGITGTLSSQTDLNAALGTKLVATSNLSDVANASSARANLGLTLGTNVEPAIPTGTSAQYVRGDKTVQDLNTAVRVNRLDQMAAPQANVNANGFKLTNIATPTTGGDAASKTYVDNVAQGLQVKTASRLATTTALPTNTSLSSGSILTATTNGALSVDGTTPSVNDRILVKNESDASHNGIYSVTAVGSGAAPYSLTRVTDMDASNEIPGAYTFVTEGTANANTGWIISGSGPFIIGTSNIVFTQFSSSGVPDATTSVKGKVMLAGDLGGTADFPTTPTAVHVTGAEAISGVKTFINSPIVPTPSGASQVANMGYTDLKVAKTGDTMSGNLGIGAAPSLLLDTVGTNAGARLQVAGIRNASTSTGTEASLKFANTTTTTTTDGSGSGEISVTRVNTPNAGDTTMSLKTTLGGVLATKVSILPDGKVGIGKTPTATLDVNGSVAATSFSGSGSGITGVQQMMPVFNVKDTAYGAVGNGTTDDSTAIQAALTAIGSTGGILYFPAGSYKITTPLNLKSNMIMRGAGANASTIVTAGTTFVGTSRAPIEVGINGTVSNIVIEQIGFNIATNNYPLTIAGSSNITIQDCYFTGTCSNAGSIFVQAGPSVDTSNIKILNNRFYNTPNLPGIYISPTNAHNISDVRIEGCHFENTYTYGVHIDDGTGTVTDVKILNNTFIDLIGTSSVLTPGCAVFMGLNTTYKIDTVLIDGNFYSNSRTGVYAQGFVWAYNMKNVRISNNVASTANTGAEDVIAVAPGRVSNPLTNLEIIGNTFSGWSTWWDPDAMDTVEVAHNILQNCGPYSLLIGYQIQRNINIHDNIFYNCTNATSGLNGHINIGNIADCHNIKIHDNQFIETNATPINAYAMSTSGAAAYDSSVIEVYNNSIYVPNGNLTGFLIKQNALNVPPSFVRNLEVTTLSGLVRYGDVGNSATGIKTNSRVYNDAVARFQQLMDGTLGWGDGTNPIDTTLYRSAAGVLNTGGAKLSGLGTPTSSNDAATKSYVDTITINGGTA